MDIVKYFYEEPAALHARAEVVPSDSLVPLDALLAGPRFYRGYLAGTCLQSEEQGGIRIGATALDDPTIWLEPLLTLFESLVWTRLSADGEAVPCTDPSAVLADPAGTIALSAGRAMPSADTLHAAASDEREVAAPSLRAVLGEVDAVLLPEPAHDGFDWSVFACVPLRERYAAALRGHPAPGARRFVLPYQRARGEHRFYFEQWQLDALPDFIEEI